MISETTTVMFQEQGSNTAQILSKGQRFLLESVTILFFTVKNSLIPVVQQYIYFLVDRKYNFTLRKEALLGEEPLSAAITALEDGHDFKGVSTEDVEGLLQLSHTVNEESSFMVLYLNIAELLPSAIVVLLLGAYSDTIGKRKFMMWLPCLGNGLYAFGFVLPLYVSNGDIDSATTRAFFIIAALCSGLLGNVPTFLSGNASYISDTDTPNRRTLRLAIVELNIGLTFGIANFVQGFWIKETEHFEQPLWFLCILSALTFMVIIFLLKEPVGSITPDLETVNRPSIVNLQSIKKLFKFSSNSHKKLWFVFVAYILFIFVQQGQERTYVLFLQNPPLYYRAFEIGSFFLVTYVLSGLASWPGIPLLQNCVDDRSIAILGLVSKITGSLIMAFASTTPILYIASVAQMFHLVPFAVARSIASQQVGDDEQGSVYALIHSAQAVVAFLGPLLHNAIFAATLRWMSGFVFLVSGPLLVIPVILLLYMKYLNEEDFSYSYMEDESPPSKVTNPMSESTCFGSKENQSKDGFGAMSRKSPDARQEKDM